MGSSGIKWVRLGDYIEQRRENNSSLKYDVELIEGVNNDGEFQPTKALTDNINLKPYKVVRHGDIVYNPSRLNIGSLAYRTGGMCIVSHLYQVFYIKKEYQSTLSAEYLTLYLRRSEFYRYVDYDNFGSQRAEYNLRKLGELLIPLPAIAEQQKVVNVWKAFREIKEQNEAKAVPLMQVCQSYIQELKHKYPMREIGPYIEECNLRNDKTKYNVQHLKGVTSDGIFDATKAKVQDLDFSNYKIVKKNNFAYNPSRINIGSIALSTTDVCIISPMYIVFHINGNIIIPEYLALWFKRAEFQRSTLFFASGSVRDTFGYKEMCNVKIPLPPIDIQQAIVNIYKCANEAKQIAEEADRLSREVCPALLQHVIHS